MKRSVVKATCVPSGETTGCSSAKASFVRRRRFVALEVVLPEVEKPALEPREDHLPSVGREDRVLDLADVLEDDFLGPVGRSRDRR